MNLWKSSGGSFPIQKRHIAKLRIYLTRKRQPVHWPWHLWTCLHSLWKMWGDGTLQCSCCVGHMAWAPKGREGREAGPKGRNLEVGARRAPRLLVWIEDHQIKACKMKAPKNYYLHNEFNSRVYKLFTGTLEQLFVFFSCWSRVCRLIRVRLRFCHWRRLF